jgi:predicted ThiF/HesA family dinucleotide-utilizing enzyme
MNQQGRDYADPLCQFLGGDELAAKICRALRRDDIPTVETLREWYWRGTGSGPDALEPGFFIRDVPRIGPVAMERIAEKLTKETRNEK